MKYHYKSTQHKAIFLSIASFVLFVLYSFHMYMKHQTGVVALSYFVASGMSLTSATSSGAWIGALLGTLLCIIPALILSRLLYFPLRFKALALLPSYIILGLITGISPENINSTENSIPLLSSMALLLFSVLLVFLSQVYHEDRAEHAPICNYLTPNVFISCIGMLFCMFLTNTDRQLHVQLDLANGIHQNDHSVVDRLPHGETTTNNTITALQVLSLSKRGQLADNLFSLSHLKGSNSLLPDKVPASAVYHTPTLVYGHLQAVPVGEFRSATSFLEKALSRRMALLSDTSATQADSLRVQPLIDYYLCALLLDRDIPRFSDEVFKYYNVDETLPKHYREALILYNSQDSLATRIYEDLPMDSVFLNYAELQAKHKGNVPVQRKACVRAYPHSYWNYYFYGYNNLDYQPHN